MNSGLLEINSSTVNKFRAPRNKFQHYKSFRPPQPSEGGSKKNLRISPMSRDPILKIILKKNYNKFDHNLR